MNIFGYEISASLLIGIIGIISSVVVGSIFLDDNDILTRSNNERKRSNMTKGFFILLLYIIFLLGVDSLINTPDASIRVEGETYTYLEYVDANHSISPFVFLVIFVIFYVILIYKLYKSRKYIDNHDSEKLLQKLEKEWEQISKTNVKITYLLEYVNFYTSERPWYKPFYFKGIWKNKFILFVRFKLEKIGFRVYRFISNVGYEFLALLGPMAVVQFFPNMSIWKHMALIILLALNYKIFYELIKIFEDLNNNYELCETFMSLEFYKKKYTTDKLIWITNTKKHSLFSPGREDIIVLVHRDSGYIEVAKKLESYYNIICKNVEDCKQLKTKIAELNDSSDKLLSVIESKLNIKITEVR